MHDLNPAALMRAIAMLAGIALVTSALTASAATATPAPRTTAIAWAECNYGLEQPPVPPSRAYALTSDGIVIRTNSWSTSPSDDPHAESAVIGPKRFRAIAEELERSGLFDPPAPRPRPSPDPATGLGPIGRVTPSDTRRPRFAVRRGGVPHEARVARNIVHGSYGGVFGGRVLAIDAPVGPLAVAPRADAFAVCRYDA